MYDVIHFHDDIDLSFPFFSHLLRANDKPRLLHCHSLPYTYKGYKRNYLSGALLRKIADLYIALSKYTVRLLLDLGLPKNKVTILPNAVDTVAFRPTGNKAENTVLYAARITPQKGLDVLLNALFYLDVQTHLIIIGPVGDRSFFSKIEYLMQKVIKETSHTITYLGCVDKSTLIDCHQKASVFVCPSIFDHFPISNLEAMACGTPVVGTYVKLSKMGLMESSFPQMIQKPLPSL
jgi:glycosyltransferase involved in cell wall biosynthesis